MPAPEGEACGGDVFGWKTECEFYGTISYQNPLDPTQYLEIDPFFGPTYACCEGNPSQATADEACVDSCVVRMCDIAKNIYDQIAQENGWNCVMGCQFDIEGCRAGIPVQQFPHPPLGDNHPHEVIVTCEATNVQPRHPDGTFAFIEQPDDVRYPWDPVTCGPEAQAAGYSPLGSLVANTAQGDAGTFAIATWWSGTEQGKLGTVDVEADLAYAVRPCGDANCLELSRMDVSVPAGAYAGLPVEAANLSLIGVSEAPVVDHIGGFAFPPGSLHFVLAAAVGGVPLETTRTNTTVAHGRVSPTADLFEVTELRLAHEDTDFGADLRLDVVASHTNRAPHAAIRRLDNPLDCDEPVVLQAATVDPDGDSMQHYWWTPVGMMTAPTAELVLPSGSHLVVLVSVDHHGAYDTTSLTYQRSCS
jgi:hypothetical protein